MPIADDRLSKLQTLKLIQAVNNKDIDQIRKLVDYGIPNLINYSGIITVYISYFLIYMRLYGFPW